MTEAQARDILTAAYAAEVEARHGKFINDSHTQANIASVARCLVSEEPGFGIFCCGLCGNGKTTMLYAFQNAVNYLNALGKLSAYGDNVGIRVIDAKEVMMLSKTDYKRYRAIRDCDMLGLEDIGREPTEVLDYGNVLSPLVDLLEARYNKQLFTFVTSNLQPKEVRQKYGTRIADRFNEMMTTIVFENPTYRNK